MWNGWRFGSIVPALLMRRLQRTGARLTVIAHEPFLPLDAPPICSSHPRFSGPSLRCWSVSASGSLRHHRHAGPDRRAAAPDGGRVAPQVIRIGSNASPVERRPNAGGGPNIGFFSTAAFGKRYDVVLDAFRIAAEIPGRRAGVDGRSSSADHPNVRAVHQAVSRHPPGVGIRLTGGLSLVEVARETATLDLFLFPMGTGANTRSSTLPGALGSGIPTVAVRGFETDLALFRDGENVAFADEMTGPAFATAALRLLGIRPRRRVWAKGAGASTPGI